MLDSTYIDCHFFYSLRYNKLSGLPCELAHCQQLTELNIEGNRIQRLPNGLLQSMPMLSSVVLSRNSFTTIPDENTDQFSHLKVKCNSLIGLDLSYNLIEKLPDSLFEMMNLELLDLTSNRLQQLPPTVGKMSHLVQLHLEFNQLASLPSEICELTHLKVLNLDANKLTRLPSSIGSVSCVVSSDRLNVKNE
ncbi:hypothetical protein P879_06697 [Paragonimus westermani]|uniref:Leucine-rich repeat protein SHOC2 n=1 Tax=Paragonimus westermani TaxID=34504 RepID=A0A8T0DLH7_9TREM|nr:hypothetical protein P879_06697 [Paragonimus westermani]